ncbi:MAG: class I SAM-dependent methyltransferase [Thermoplasmata archaeon]|nr:class I SAM-dependent methyltransferase [Thermoplasmata archaeon]
MTRNPSPELDLVPTASPGATVPSGVGLPRSPLLLTPAARKGMRHRMLLIRQAGVDRVQQLTGASSTDLKVWRHELQESALPDLLLQRGAGLAFARELPQGPLLYLLVRALRPRKIVETGVGPGYSTAWLLAALNDNGGGELVSIGPGPIAGRPSGVHDYSVGQFVHPSLRARWTLVLGNTEERVRQILNGGGPIDLFFYDNGPSADRARFELRTAWGSLSERAVLLAHHVDANPVWAEFCTAQGSAAQILDPGPPPMGAVSVRSGARF